MRPWAPGWADVCAALRSFPRERTPWCCGSRPASQLAQRGSLANGRPRVQASEIDVHDTLLLLVDHLNGVVRIGERLSPPTPLGSGPPFLPHDHPLFYVEDAMVHGGICALCAAWARVLFATPCRPLPHLLCADCARHDSTACMAPGCRQPYLMQSKDDPARKQDNPNPQWDVPLQLIEFQPAYVQRGARPASRRPIPLA